MNSKHVFFSGRFGGEKEGVARELHAALRNLGVNAHIVDAGPGRSFGAKTNYGLCHMEVMICIVYDDYGEKTASSSCTFWELKHAIDNHIPIYYLKMSDTFPPKPPQDFDGGNEGQEQINFVIKKDDFYHDWYGKEWNAMVCAEEVKRELHKIFREKSLDESILNMNPNDLSTLSNSPSNSPQVQHDLTQHTPEPVVDIERGGTFDKRILNMHPNDLSTLPNSRQVQELTQHTPKPPVVDTDEEEIQPEEMKKNKTDEKDQKADEEKEKTFFQKRGTQVTILLAIIAIIVSIVMVLTLKKLNMPTAAPTCASSILLGNENEVLAEDASTDANFGWSVSIDRSIAVVGAYRDGSAYVFERRGGSEWKEVAKLTSDASPPDFGVSVAIDEDTIIVGARGSAYVFQNTNGSEWDFVTKLVTNEGGYDGDKFGMAVALDGNTAIVGAVGNGIKDFGSAYIFVRENSKWAFQKRISAFDGTVGDDFGRSVAVHGDTAIVGKISSAFIFSRIGSDWDVRKRLIPKDAPIEYMFGYNVAINEDTAVIGAIGAAYIFTLSGSEWAEEKMLSVEIPDIAIRASVALDENTLILGSAGHKSISTYVHDGVKWKEAAKITATSVSTDDQFGYSIAVSENVVMIGAPGCPNSQGSIYIMDGNCKLAYN